MGLEEQQEEREVLSSIFGDEITDISETEFSIAVKLDDDDGDVDGDGEAEAPTITVHITYPPSYPDAAPELKLSNPSSSRPTHHHRYLSLLADAPLLLRALEPVIADNVGMAMVFTLVSALKDSAEQLMAERRAAEQAERDAAARRAEEEENRRFEGERVTREGFLKWREGFRREMAEREESERRRVEEEEGGGRGKGGAGARREERRVLTGRELWERGLVGKEVEVEVDEEGEGDGERLEGEMGKLSVGA